MSCKRWFQSLILSPFKSRARAMVRIKSLLNIWASLGRGRIRACGRIIYGSIYVTRHVTFMQVEATSWDPPRNRTPYSLSEPRHLTESAFYSSKCGLEPGNRNRRNLHEYFEVMTEWCSQLIHLLSFAVEFQDYYQREMQIMTG